MRRLSPMPSSLSLNKRPLCHTLSNALDISQKKKQYKRFGRDQWLGIYGDICLLADKL